MHLFSYELTHWLRYSVGLADLHVGVVELALDSDRTEHFADALQDREERERFIAIRNPARRCSRMGGRLAAYQALRSYYRCNCGDWTIRNDDYGAPYLPGSEVHLSITHSPYWAVAAAGKRLIGIDAEQIAVRPDSLFRYFFNESEQRWILDEGHAASCKRLHLLWSRKEAVCKLTGKGGQLPFKTVAVIGAGLPYHFESHIFGDHVFSIAWYRDGADSS